MTILLPLPIHVSVLADFLVLASHGSAFDTFSFADPLFPAVPTHRPLPDDAIFFVDMSPLEHLIVSPVDALIFDAATLTPDPAPAPRGRARARSR